MTINKVTLAGFVGKNPEIRISTKGKEVISFSLAINNRGQTQWFKIAVEPPELIKFCNEYVKKGRKLYIVGELESCESTNYAGYTDTITRVLVKENGKIEFYNEESHKDF